MRSNRLSRSQFAILFGYRCVLVISCLFMVLFQSFPIMAPIIHSYWQTFEPRLCRNVFFFFGVVHGYEFLRLSARNSCCVPCRRCCRGHRKRKKTSIERRRSSIEKAIDSLLPDGFFGRRGRTYAVVLLFLKVYEIISWTYQTYQVSTISMVRFPLLISSMTICWTCVGVIYIESLHKRSNHMETSSRLILLDTIGDLLVSMIVPVGALLPSFIAVMQHISNIYDLQVFVDFCTAGQIATISSPIDMLLRFVPLGLICFHLRDLEANFIDTNTLKVNRIVVGQQNPEPNFESNVPHSIMHRMKKYFLLPAGILWSLGVAGATIYALFMPNCEDIVSQTTCLYSSMPIFTYTGKCSCLYMKYDCEKLGHLTGWPNADIYKVVENDLLEQFSYNLHVIYFLKCHFKTFPSSVQDLPKVMILGARVGSLESLQLDLSRMKHLTTFFILDSPLQGYRVTFPERITNLVFVSTNLSTISFATKPEDLQYLTSIAIDHNHRLSIVPEAILRLPNLAYLSMCNNSIQYLPENITKLTRLRQLRLSGNQIFKVSPRLREIQRLIRLSLDGNQVTSIPWTREELKAWNSNLQGIKPGARDFKLILLALNPICDAEHALALVNTTACRKPCAVGCTPVVREEVICHQVCYTPACNYSNGNCDGILN